ncbi:DUF4249 domain-containing protein [Arcticibacterium luteifluviistationis]|uniref:DUF4249 domain-containing protein n=1 Tax=Arcticibacterium luteifluviistationis TaxID=1784714 RepID=A0A2Z4GEL9_9BACT|nr:DUF4249 domain-containing protein [Arcticibacterium luteifluviistationis]AWV99706.1 DUF4249 domain-containing protein [Arcticibacterium luteifluviistationis]
MKKIIIPTFALLSLALSFSSCEDVIDIDVQDAVEQLVIDGWLTNKAEDQYIKLSLTQPYFDNSDVRFVSGAEVVVFEADSTAHPFTDMGDGRYLLKKEDAGFLEENGQYALYVKYQNDEFAALSKLNRVPAIDSLSYEFFEFPFAADDSTESEGYFAQFYATDPEGEGDTYWIRTTKNGKLINDPSQISLAYDAGFSPGSRSDGLLFILPVRQSINDGLYQHNDSIHIEIWSITPDAYLYLSQVAQESSNGGIFATPPANIPTNIFNRNENSPNKALGFFGISAVSEFSTVLDSTLARPTD